MNPQIRRRFSEIILCVLVICLLVVIGRNLHFDVDHVRSVLQRYPLWLNALIYIILYVVSTTLVWVGPKDIVRVLGALFYGGALSTALIYVAELINACILFHLSRRFGRDVVLKQWFQKKDIDQAADRTTFLGIMSLRINVLFSFRLLDLAYGLTRVSFRKYLTAAVIASPLRLFVIQYAIVMFWDVLKTVKTPDSSALVRVFLKMSDIMMREPFLLKAFLVYFLIVVVLSVAAVAQKIRRKKSGSVPDGSKIQSQGQV